ncbi:mechanosensitive ion channel family protein [Halorussus sp. AFM4]|uniref:mechanosensitive ion channel family protein n=1 Tax=Halorussus sp. AFM4 TaxID=3421651 RepID=UPI003EB97709
MFALQLVPDLTSLAVALALRVAFFAAAFTVVTAVGRFAVRPIVARLLAARGVGPTVERPVQRLVRVLVWFVGLTVAFSAAGLGNLLSASATIAAAFTLAVGLASQSLMSNVVSGAFIIADERFNIGDWIRWGDKEGVVEDISFRVTRVRTFDNELVTVPNSTLTDGEVTNPVAGDRLRVTHEFRVSRDHDVDDVAALLLAEAAGHPAILADPEPTVRATDLGADAVTLAVRFWIGDPGRDDFVAVRSEYIQRVDERLAAEEIELAA